MSKEMNPNFSMRTTMDTVTITVSVTREFLNIVVLLEKRTRVVKEFMSSVKKEYLNGDVIFQGKCSGVMREFLNGVAILERCIGVMKESLNDVALLERGRASVMKEIWNGIVLLEQGIGVTKEFLNGVAPLQEK